VVLVMNALEEFRAAIYAAGINPPDAIEADGKLRRFPTNGKRGDDSGWYVLHGDGIPAGAFGDWRTGFEQTWRQDVGRELSLAEREAQGERIAVVRQQREAEEAQRHGKTRQRAADIWEQSGAPTTNHPYLKRKGLAAHGLRMYRGDDLTINGMGCKFALVVPMRDAAGELHSLQFIGLHGEKRFLPGGRIAACYFTIGTPNGRVCICEGFATGASVHEATGEAVAVAFNAINLDAVARTLREKMPEAQIIVCADDDYRTAGNPGLTKATEAARATGGLVAIPDFGTNRPDGATDFNDLAQHRGAEAVKRAVANARKPDVPEHQPRTPARAASATEADLNENKAERQAERLVRLALELFEINRSDLDEPFALKRHGPQIALMFRGSRDALRATLAREFRRRTGSTPNAAALADALTALQGEALESEPRSVHLRVADHHGGVVLDLGRQDGRAVLIRASNWEMLERSPVIFRRTALTGELPLPEHGGSIEMLRDLLNVADETWPLVLAWLVAAFLPSVAHPILMLGGEQGSGKTTAAKFLGAVVDPSPAPVRSQPSDSEGWAIAASGSWVVTIDNVSTIPGWLSDSLCKAVTGDGLVRRKLYTDSDLAVLAFRRVVALTSIDAGALRGDLGDRILLADLEPIHESRRRSETELEQTFERMRARIFGALLDLLVAVLAELPGVNVGRLPRMADFARVLAALDKVLGSNALDYYRQQRGRVVADVLDADPVAVAIQTLAEATPWSGTQGELLKRITPDGSRPDGWPKNARALTSRLRRLSPGLRQIGVRILIPQERTARGRIIEIWPEVAAEQSSQASQQSLSDERSSDDHGDGRDDRAKAVTIGAAAIQRGSDGNDGSDGVSPSVSNAGRVVEQANLERFE
jgi:phage/plasmid primase-like uncharacterized protein